MLRVGENADEIIIDLTIQYNLDRVYGVSRITLRKYHVIQNFSSLL